jgi:hypothetical protein
MALIFPSNPTLNQIFSTGSLSWIWNGQSWNNGTSILVTSNLVSGSAQFTNGNSAAFDTTSNVTFGQVTASFAKITGSIFGTASFSEQAFSASYALTASYAVSASYSLTSSFSIQSQTASFVTTAQTASYVLLAQTASYISTASYALAALSASYAPNIYVLPNNVVSSSAQLSNGGGVAFDTNSNITVNQITASFAKITNLNVEYVTSSVMVITGSNKFGDASNDKQEFTGSVSISGSLSVNGPITGTSSLASTASYFAGVSNGTTNYVTKFTGANTIGSSSIFESGSRVGIGTSSPSAPLHISNSPSSYILVESTAAAMSGSAYYILKSNSGNGAGNYYRAILGQDAAGTYDWAIGNFSTAKDVLAFYSGGVTERMRIDASGNVGIGTASPSAKLDIGSTASAGALSGLIFSGLNSTSTKADYVKMFANVEFNVAAAEGGGYQLQVLQQGAYKNSIVASGITNNSTNYLALSTTNEAVRIIYNGNVGIGTTSPTSKLTTYYTGIYDSNTTRFVDIAGEFFGTNPSSATNAGAFTGIRMGNITAGKYAMMGAVSEDNLGFSRSNGLSFWTSPQDTAPIERLRISSAGNVGIGTASPDTTLDVQAANASFRVYGTGASDTPQFQLRNGSQIWQQIVDGADLNKWKLRTGAGTTVLNCDPSGGLAVTGALSATGNLSTISDLRITDSGGSKSILIGNQDSGGTNTPVILRGVNATLQIGTGTSWSASGGGTLTTIANFSSTGLAVTGALSATGNGSFAGAYGSVSVTSNTGTNGADVRFINTGGTYYVGVDSSTGNAFGATAYDMIHFLPTGRGLSTVISGSGVVTRVSSAGFAVTGTVSATSSGGVPVILSGTSSPSVMLGGSSASEPAIRFEAGPIVGVVLANQSAYTSIKATAFTVSSDSRFKLNPRPITNSGTLIDAMLPKLYDTDTTKPMHGNGKANLMGFFAQELFAVYPQAVAKGDDGEEITQEWGIDYAQLVPVLVAELQSLRTRLAALEAK